MNKKLLLIMAAALGCMVAQSAHGWWGRGWGWGGPYYGYGWGGPYYGYGYGPGIVGGTLGLAADVATLGAAHHYRHRAYDDAYNQGYEQGRAQANQNNKNKSN